ncbi:uncharacterized protein DSM5745_02695 [Aspergillus mulundensis]|uniref:Uncharacterized protein n=1 Tax=Aspergillus mulundensis TaxID=1810919 RepID=A0A3D8SIE0_9EURO|nr:hypothetical protein DSM5745_02695 [Aspergillus mulundensis]RDW86053.1 hypothetical protein DSM5745_02695 [Aspergillus mulundensis]
MRFTGNHIDGRKMRELMAEEPAFAYADEYADDYEEDYVDDYADNESDGDADSDCDDADTAYDSESAYQVDQNGAGYEDEDEYLGRASLPLGLAARLNHAPRRAARPNPDGYRHVQWPERRSPSPGVYRVFACSRAQPQETERFDVADSSHAPRDSQDEAVESASEADSDATGTWIKGYESQRRGRRRMEKARALKHQPRDCDADHWSECDECRSY